MDVQSHNDWTIFSSLEMVYVSMTCKIHAVAYGNDINHNEL